MSYVIIEKATIYHERRSGERRVGSFPQFNYWGHQGRRGYIRRREDLANSYLDKYPASLWWLIVAVLILCFMDAIFTLSLLQHGAKEINPLMAELINFSIPLFAGVKMAVTGVGLVGLIIHHNFIVFRIFRVQQFIYGFLLLYSGLVVYESFLLLPEFLLY
ncbi:conserved hypothetical protein [Nitrosococcus oceani ATCC 19707]|uniref:DUF5658 domain-containing protein n=2 Tax=Nitrosococcus oceani TaxID=1229 RepID=Q3JAI5_NITOC|nr:DUF5658 family protein [Nitrosococcus oceani]ABA58161.1 conserved hypothetical protein [Nitrosococcus oceani ATCC 19707]EDZ68143.1 hypothetical protein NOC27_1470 [Nitrosococcus oceani AFC27]KFI19376.1 hypothetical protein IB75_08970 [Nitrosococcus oceani C-27]GEM20381.1 hypothetical protein NONS58_17950 [Nitrosococcus oceani]